MFCFPISDHVMLLEGIVSFKCRLMHGQMYAQLMKKKKIPMRASRGLKWKNKMYKLKGLFLSVVTLPVAKQPTDESIVW